MTITAAFSRYADLPALIGLMEGDEKHNGASASTLDVLWVLYDRVLDVTPDTAEAPDRDRFLLSKGHGPAAYYAVLAAKGFLDVPTLRGWTTFDSPLGHHPDRVLVPGVEIGIVGTPVSANAAGRIWVRGGNRTVITNDFGRIEQGLVYIDETRYEDD